MWILDMNPKERFLRYSCSNNNQTKWTAELTDVSLARLSKSSSQAKFRNINFVYYFKYILQQVNRNCWIGVIVFTYFCTINSFRLAYVALRSDRTQSQTEWEPVAILFYVSVVNWYATRPCVNSSR